MYYRDNSLRAPAEALPVTGCVLVLAGFALGWPADGLQLGLKLPVVVAAALLLTVRLFQALALRRYRRGLGSSSGYKLLKLPVARHSLFLGRGFIWRRKHRQRLYEIREAGLVYGGLVGDTALHGVGLDAEREVWMNLAARNGHTLVVGTTRVGKTRLAEMLVAQDIIRGEVVIVLDPKGDVGLLRRMVAAAEQVGRSHNFHIFHLGFPEYSDVYNPVGDFSHITEVATRLARQLPSGGDSSAFREFAWRFTNIVTQALVALGYKPTLQLIVRNITNIENLFIKYCKHYMQQHNIAMPKIKTGASRSRTGKNQMAIELANYIRAIDVDDPVLLGLMSAFNYERNYFDKITASLLPLLEKMTTGDAGSLLTPNLNSGMHKKELRWRQIICSGGIAYVGLDSLSDPDVAGAVGNSMLADLTSVAGGIYKHGINPTESGKPKRQAPAICLHVDEFNELAKEEFIPLLNKSGGAGMQVTAYTQTASDMEAAVGDLARAEQMRGNMNTLIMMRVKNRETAELLTDKLQKVQVYARLPDSSIGDNDSATVMPEFSARSGDRLVALEMGLLEPEDLMSLPVGHAFILLGGGCLYKVRLPLLAKINDIAEDMESIAEHVHMRRQQS